LKRLKEDKRFIVHASAQAQKATDFILNIKNEEKELNFDSPIEKPDKSVEREKQLREIREKENEKSIEMKLEM